MGIITLYHGTPNKLVVPQYGGGDEKHDYGKGFYLTESIELAKEWACNEGVDGFVNEYELETDGLKILDLSSDEYTLLHWLALLVDNRRFRVSTPVMRRGLEWLKEHWVDD